MIQINIVDAPDIVMQISIDETNYKLRLTYNQYHGFWTMHLWDYNENPLATNIKVIPNFPLLLNKHCFDVPKGEFIVISNEESLDRDSFKDGRATIVYMTEDEWDAV